MARQYLPVATLALVAAVSVLSLSLRHGPEDEQYVDRLYLDEHPLVIASDRLVCSMGGGQQARAGILGKDGSRTVAVDGVVYWTFGDTIVDRGGIMPNSISWSADTNAASCPKLVPKTVEGGADALLPQIAGEMTVWPLGMEATDEDTVHFFYASIVGESDSWESAGVGLASFDTKTLTARRAFDGALPWRDDLPRPKRTVVDGDFVYMILGQNEDEGWQSRILLARAPIDQIEDLSAYQYWQPADGLRPGQWIWGGWNGDGATWGIEFERFDSLWWQPGAEDGVDVSYNEFLNQWLAIYATGFATSINARSAAELTGPWDGPETTLINCSAFHESSPNEFLCYSAAHQEVYSRDGGRTIYVAYSNGDTYEVYLHVVRLAARVDEWVSPDGRTFYLTREQTPPEGFERRGAAFYASDIPVPGFVSIHRWAAPTGDIRYGPIAPNERYVDLGVAFYAPADKTAADATKSSHAPVYRWVRGSDTRYSPLSLETDGYIRMEEAFYAACPDSDHDGLSDCLESFIGTDPYLADTDGDGLTDGYEFRTPGCDPLVYTNGPFGVTATEALVLGKNPCTTGSGLREVVRR